MAVVCISRQFGAGGLTLGKKLSERLGYLLVDRGILEQIAKEANVSVDWVEAVERETGGLLMRLINSLVSPDFMERHLGKDRSDFDEKKYILFLTRVINNLAGDDNMVIVGRAAQFILPSAGDIVKVLLVAEREDRVRFMMDQYQLPRASAESLVNREEKRRASFLRAFHAGDPDDPGHYTVVFNTSHVGLGDVENALAGYIGAVLDKFTRPIW